MGSTLQAGFNKFSQQLGEPINPDIPYTAIDFVNLPVKKGELKFVYLPSEEPDKDMTEDVLTELTTRKDKTIEGVSFVNYDVGSRAPRHGGGYNLELLGDQKKVSREIWDIVEKYKPEEIQDIGPTVYRKFPNRFFYRVSRDMFEDLNTLITIRLH
jgi:hypothetical protein